MTARVFFVLTAAAALSASALAQQPQAPARDLPRDQLSKTGSGVIAGVIRAADTGLPIRGADIRLTGTSQPGGPRGALTDAEGRYEFTGLPDGDYTLIASKIRYMTMTFGQTRAGEEGRPVKLAVGQRVDDIDFTLPLGAVIVLRVGNRFGDPAVAYRVNLYQAAFKGGVRALAPVNSGGFSNVTDDRGEIRLSGLQPGEYFASAELNLPPTETAEREVLTYFPGTPAEAEAQPITVGLGEEVVFGFNTMVSRTLRITGTIVGSGRPELRIERRTPAGMYLLDLLHEVSADGSFSRSGLSPGEYLFTARSDKEFGTLTLQLGNEDITGAVLTMRRAEPVRGRLTFDGAAPRGVAQTAFTLRPTSEDNSAMYVSQFKTADWTFEIPAPGGNGVLRLLSPPRGWYLKAVLLDGRDVTDTILNFDSYQGKKLEVVVTQTATEISGRVTDAAGRDVPNYVAVAFAEDSQRWTPLTRAIASARPDQQGRFSIRGLPPGRYLVAAVDYLQTGRERDPKILGQLRTGATAVALAEGATQSVTVRLQQ